MAKDANWRFDPFSNLFNFQPITDEPQTVGFLDEWGIYGFVLDESPKIESGSDSLTIIEDIPGGAQWIEIDSALSPAPGEYRLDRVYDMAIVQFNPADDGKSFLVSYQGKGTVLNVKKIRQLVSSGALDTLLVNSLLTVVGNLDLAPGTLNFNGTPVAGFLDSGVPFFKKVFNATFASGAASVFVNHGIPGGIFTNNKVVDFGGAVGAVQYISPSLQTHNLVPRYITLSDTQIGIARGTGGTDKALLWVSWIL